MIPRGGKDGERRGAKDSGRGRGDKDAGARGGARGDKDAGARGGARGDKDPGARGGSRGDKDAGARGGSRGDKDAGARGGSRGDKDAGARGGSREGRPPKPPRDRDRPKPRTPGRGKPVPRGRDATEARPAAEPRTPSRPPGDILYGRNPIREALRAGRREVKRVWATTSAAREPWLEGVLIEPADGDWITQRAGTDAHQGLCADVGPYPYADPASLLTGTAPLIVALDEIQDVQNLGAIARTAEAAGATGLVLPRHRSAEVTAAAAKASAGAVEHLAIAQVRNVADYLAEAKHAGCWVYGAAAKGTPYRKPDYAGGVVLVMGAEGKGLRPRVQAQCDDVVSLPMRGRVDSLNVSAAAAALLYGIVDARQRPS